MLLSTHVMQEVENTCERVLVISRGKLVANSPVQSLLQQALELRSVQLEVEGNGIEAGLAGIDGITSVESQGVENGRKSYLLSVSADADPRADIFRLAKSRNWTLWELHEESPRLEDVFHNLTVAAEPAHDE